MKRTILVLALVQQLALTGWAQQPQTQSPKAKPAGAATSRASQLDKARGKPQLQVQVRLFRNGEQVFTGRETTFDGGNQADMKRLETSGAIMLGTEMLPGEYQLQVVVTDQRAKEKYRVASRWIDFEVVK